MAELDLDQGIVSADVREKRRTDTEIALARCQTMILARKALLKEKIAEDRAKLEAAERAARAAATAATTTTTTAAPVMRGPKIDTLALPD